MQLIKVKVAILIPALGLCRLLLRPLRSDLGSAAVGEHRDGPRNGAACNTAGGCLPAAAAAQHGAAQLQLG